MRRLRLGAVIITAGAREALSDVDIAKALARHQHCDWGNVPQQDWELNDEAADDHGRVLSSYTNSNDVKFWIITEWNRSYTTVLLPSEY